jgi:N-methylhydantoinase A
VQARYQLNMRYAGQSFAMSFDLAQGALHDLGFVDAGLGARAMALFNTRHMAEFHHIREAEVPEITGVRLETRVVTPSPLVGAGDRRSVAKPVPAKYRRANLGRGFADVPIYLGTDLRKGSVVAGPAIIDEVFTTIVVYPNWTARVDDVGDYEMVRE